MTLQISQSIVAAQVGLLLITLVLSFVARSHRGGLALAWLNSVLALALIGGTAAQLATPVKSGIVAPSSASLITYVVLGVIVAGLTWGALRIIATMLAARHRRFMASPKTASRLSDELRDVLRGEGIELDARLHQAEADREQFLYALEERHARQIAGLAQEYQHEAQTILRQLLSQLAAEQLEPMVEARLAEQKTAIESQIAAIDTAVAGEALTALRSEFSELTDKVETAEARVATLRAQNPETSIEEIAEQRLAGIEALIAERMDVTKSELDTALAATVEQIDGRINEVGALLDAKVESASNPLAQRMVDAEAKVEGRLAEWTHVLDGRFSETGQILNQRILEQEQALEQRVVIIETALAQRLEDHTGAIESMLNGHDGQLQSSLAQQSEAVSAHFGTERDRLIIELTEHAVGMQEQIANELAEAEIRARETVTATQVAWNHFTEELEERFANNPRRGIAGSSGDCRHRACNARARACRHHHEVEQ